MNPPALLTAPAQTPGQKDAQDATGRQDAIPKGVADEFHRLYAEQEQVIQRLRLALAERERQLAVLLVAVVLTDGE